MSSDRHREIKRIFLDVCERPRQDRDTYLRHACLSDSELRREVESLLAFHDRAAVLDRAAAVAAPALEHGQQLAQYSILECLGKGAMGEVYRARDLRLERDVAIKVLPAGLGDDAKRIARFDREAKLLGALHHPNVGAVYGLEQADGIRFIVLELIDGETLTERLRAGPLAVAEALAICRQVASALEAAHGHGIVHRDLKPANVMIDGDDEVKVVDFGIAKAATPAGDGSDGSSREELLTRPGMVLGTVPYMSPEQVRGQAVDGRADIWALGCVLFETLSGRRAFDGDTAADILADILDRNPDWAALPAETPAPVRSLLHRCLKKKPEQRLHHIADARLEIEEALRETATETAIAVGPARRRQPALIWGLTMAAATATIVALRLLLAAATPAPASAVRLVVTLPTAVSLASQGGSPVALSPDGTQLVYAGVSDAGSQLFLRRLDGFQARPLAGTEGAQTPFFAADGEWIGFVTDGRLRKVALSGGAPRTICAANGLWSADWTAGETILFAVGATGLWRCHAGGSTAERLTTPDAERGELRHGSPQLLPDGERVLFGVVTRDGPRLAVLNLASGKWRQLPALGEMVGARYLPSGHLVFVHRDELMALRIDLGSLQPTGPPLPLAESVANVPGQTLAYFAVADNGTLAYVPANLRSDQSLVWVDRGGSVVPLRDEHFRYAHPRLSPDGHRLAVSAGEDSDLDIWMYELERAAWSRLTFAGHNVAPLWSPDGSRITFASNRAGPLSLFWIAADGSEKAQPLLVQDGWQRPLAWTPDGRTLIFANSESGSADLRMLAISDGTVSPLLVEPHETSGSALSPDGRWLAYTSDETGTWKVYVRRYPGSGPKLTISTGTGAEPRWSADGSKLYFRDQRSLLAVEMTHLPTTLTAAVPKPLFPDPYLRTYTTPNYDITADGRRFLMVRGEEVPTVDGIHVALDWLEELKQRTGSR